MEKINYHNSGEVYREILKKEDVLFLKNEFGFYDEYAFVSAIVSGYKEEEGRVKDFYKNLNQNQKLDFIRASTSIKGIIKSKIVARLLAITEGVIKRKILNNKNVQDGKKNDDEFEVTQQMIRGAKYKEFEDLRRSGGVDINKI